MAFRTISLAEDAYDSLAARRRPGESFTEVVRRLTARSSLADLSIILEKSEGDALARAVAQAKRERKALRAAQLRSKGR